MRKLFFLIGVVVIVFLMSGCAALKGETGKAGAPGVGKQGETGAVGQNGHDGTNGQDAILSSGPVGSRIADKPYSACHHDFLYLANGWLLFRHQANGSADQGIGSTGFEVWNVDITDFGLASEVGGVTYCTLRFDKAGRTLSYTVNTAADGKQGEIGIINL